eukprot:scaffold55127_cov29-Prasinocladus_malaysianus.AAC.4
MPFRCAWTRVTLTSSAMKEFEHQMPTMPCETAAAANYYAFHTFSVMDWRLCSVYIYSLTH